MFSGSAPQEPRDKDFGFGEAPVLMVLQGEIDWPQAGRRRPRAGRARGIPLRLFADLENHPTLRDSHVAKTHCATTYTRRTRLALSH